MTDTITEFYNAEIDITDLANNTTVNLLTTSATETAVVTDINLVPSSNMANFPFNLFINDIPVASLTGSATGPELLGVSSTMQAQVDDINYKDIKLSIFTGSGGEARNYELHTLAGNSSEGSIINVTDIPGSQTSRDNFTAVLDDTGTYLTIGDWDGNSTNDVIKYLVATGAEIQNGASTSYGAQPAYGGDNYMYWFYSSNLYRMRTDDASGGVQWQTSFSGSPSTSYPHFGTNPQPSPTGERVIICNSTYTSAVYATWLDSDTGVKRVSNVVQGTGNSGFFNMSSQASQLIPFYSVTNSAWMLLVSVGSAVRIGYMSETGHTMVEIASAVFPTQSGSAQINVYDDVIYCLDETTGSLLQYDLNLNFIATLIDSNEDLKSLSGSQRPIAQLSTPSTADIAARDYTGSGSYRVRVSGVKSTEVT